jgi:hypothetical protein
MVCVIILRLRFGLHYLGSFSGPFVNNYNSKHASAGATDIFTHLRVLLVLTDCGILAHSNQRR